MNPELPEPKLVKAKEEELPPIPEGDSNHLEVKKHIQIKWEEGAEGEQQFDLGDNILIGRPPNHVSLEIGGEQISRFHALIDSDDGNPRVRDLRSTGGTKVNGELIDTPKKLNDGDLVSLSDGIAFRVSLVDAPAPVPTNSAAKQVNEEPEHQVMNSGLDWDQVLEKCESALAGAPDFDPKEVLAKVKPKLDGDEVMGMAFEGSRRGLAHQAFKVTDLPPEDADLWFIGDIHGDLLGMESSLAYIHEHAEAIGKKPWVVFLGDFIDRGPHSHEVMLRLFDYLGDHADTTCAILGNHDAGFRYDEEGGRFSSGMKPCEYPEWLNENLDNELAVQTGKLTAQFFKKIPKAFFLPDGLIVAHGCVPHIDITPGLTSEEDLNQERALSDFVNARIDGRAKWGKDPNPKSSTHQLGHPEFDSFCEKAAEILGQPVQRMIKGHEHIPERYCIYEKKFPKWFKRSMLVINNMCVDQGTYGMGDAPPCVARWRKGKPPEVHPVKIPSYLIEKIYPENRPETEVASK